MAAPDHGRHRLAAVAGRARMIEMPPFADASSLGHAGADATFVCSTDLSRVPRSELGACLAWLGSLPGPVAVSCEVMARSEQTSTLLPPTTWHRLFRAAGLVVREEAREVAPVDEGPWAQAWRRVDPWRTGDLAVIHLLLAPSSTPVDDPKFAAAVRVLAGPQHARVAAGRRLGFLLAGYQDFHTLASWVTRIRAEDTVVLLRDSTFGAGFDVSAQLRLACAAFGTAVVPVGADLARGLQGSGVDVLISASESPANLAHQGNAATLLVARQLGIATAHAQHGIWPRAELPPPIVSVADAVLAWSDEYAEVVLADGPVRTVGAPRFDRYADAGRRTRGALYGEWADGFERHVVVATNLHWKAHEMPMDARGLVQQLAERAPRTLFTWKPHPYEHVSPPDGLPDNVVVLPESAMLAAGLEFGDVVEAADAVVTTPSTVALEASLAGVPCLVLSTGNRNRHAFVREAPLEDVDAWLEAPVVDAAASAYADRYCAPYTRGVSLDMALDALRDLAPRPLPAGVAPTLCGLYGALLEAGSKVEHLQSSLTDASRYVQSLVWTLERKDRYIESLRSRETEP